MEKKITKRENCESIIAVLETVERTDLADVMRHEIELLDKRAENKKTKESDETKLVKATVLDILANSDKALTCTEIAKALDLSTQKTTPILTKLVAENSIVKEKSGKSFVYKLA